MSEIKEHIKELTEESRSFVEKRIELAKFEAIEKFAGMFSEVSSAAIIFAIIGFTMVFLNIVLSLVLSKVLGSLIYGFGAVTAFYTCVTILIIIFKKYLLEIPLANYSISHFFKEWISKHE
jgi:hypothetical protein